MFTMKFSITPVNGHTFKKLDWNMKNIRKQQITLKGNTSYLVMCAFPSKLFKIKIVINNETKHSVGVFQEHTKIYYGRNVEL